MNVKAVISYLIQDPTPVLLLVQLLIWVRGHPIQVQFIPQNPLLLQRSTLNSGPFTFSCQRLFPSTRLNMNIHKQNGSPRLWKLSKTYLHLILEEPPNPTPYRDLTAPSCSKKILLNYSWRKKNPNLPSPSLQKSSPLAPQTRPSIPQPLGQTGQDQFCWGLFSLVMNNGWPSPLWLSSTVAPLNWPWHGAIYWPLWMAAWSNDCLPNP